MAVEFDNVALSRFSLIPTVWDAGANTPPALQPVDPLSITPGDHLDIQLVASDQNGDPIRLQLQTDVALPNVQLHDDGKLEVRPAPGQEGTYLFTIIATDGADQGEQLVSLTVSPDPVNTTRVSGIVLDTNEQPLVGVPIAMSGFQTTTGADGTFSIESINPLPADPTLIIHGEAIAGPETYPFIAEKLHLLLERPAYLNQDNVVLRPIYLPALDTASAVTINPAQDTIGHDTEHPRCVRLRCRRYAGRCNGKSIQRRPLYHGSACLSGRQRHCPRICCLFWW